MLTQYFHPEPFFKGLPLARSLRDRGHQVEVLTGFPNYPGGKLYDGYQLRMCQREILDGIRINRVPLYPSHGRNGLQRIANYLSFTLGAGAVGPWMTTRPDVIYVYNLITLCAISRILRRMWKCKIVLDVQDLWPESVTSSGMLRSRLALKLLSKWCHHEYRSADRLIVLSPGFKRNLTERGVDESKINLVYNWCDESAITQTVPDSQTAIKFGMRNRFNVVFAGTMGVVQALDTVIAAARLLQHQFPDVLFSLVGGGVDVDRLKSLAATQGNVQFLPPQPMAEIGKVLVNADVLLVHLKDSPLFEITVPSKLQAYLYAGKPILCGVRGDAAALVQRSGAGVNFAPQNAESLARAVGQLRNMAPERRTEMGYSGKRYYHEHLSFRAGVHQIESVFHDALRI